jgi:raffinose/stachyose/melibiose transport system substrate-binding protein
MANNEAILAAGTAVPIVQSYGTDWSSQLFVLADFGNVATADPAWADDYTAGERKYVDEPALAGFRHQQEAFEAGFFNDDYPSLTYDEAVLMIADGSAAHYPMLSSAISPIQQNAPESVPDIGFFAMPADDPADTTLTTWQSGGLYIPRTTEGDRLEAAKTFLAFVNSPAGCEVQGETGTPSGPYSSTTCETPADVPDLVNDIEAYLDAGRTSPALEFLSPVKGPNLPNITIEVGSGISTAEEGARTYDEDVEKQAQQLGLEGW